MKYGNLPGIDKPVSRLVLGTMIVTTDDLQRSFALLDAAAELGCTCLDTASLYAGGMSERAIGEWMAARGNRERMVISSKCGHHNADRKRVTPFDIAADLHDSLSRLKTDYVDLYMLHRDDPDVPAGPIMHAFHEHVSAGRIRAIGASNWTCQRIAKANAYAVEHGLTPFCAASPNFSLAEQVDSPWGPDCVTISGPAHAADRQWYRDQGIPVFAWSSLARGFFSGRVTSAEPEGAADVLDEASARVYCTGPNFERLRRAEQLAEEKGLTVPQIALAFVLNQPQEFFAIIGAASRDEFAANVAVLDLQLTPDELAWLDLQNSER